MQFPSNVWYSHVIEGNLPTHRLQYCVTLLLRIINCKEFAHLLVLAGIEAQAREKEQAELDSQDGESGLEDSAGDDNKEDRMDAYNVSSGLFRSTHT